jgi:branched-subunit amino acid transport protein
MTIWWTIIGMAVVTYLTRVIGFFLVRNRKNAMPNTLGSWIERCLRFVPPAIFTALIVPGLVVTQTGGQPQLHLGYEVLAGLVGAVVAWRTQNLLLTIIVGMGVFWALRAWA